MNPTSPLPAAGALPLFRFDRRVFAHQAAVEEASMRLLMVVGPRGLDRALEEVERRHELFADIRRGSPERGEHPHLAALESVTHDATYGRLT